MSKQLTNILLLVILLGVGVWHYLSKEPAPPAARTAESYEPGVAASAPSSVEAFEKSQWSDEQHWLVDQTVRDVAEMLAFAVKGEAYEATALQSECTPTERNSTQFALTLSLDGKEAKKEVKLQNHLWATQNYSPIITQLVEQWDIKVPSTVDGPASETPNALFKPHGATLIAESKRISAALSKSPLQPDLHVEAAVVIGTLALREAAGLYCDTRPLLCRMTAHLAMAEALGAKPSVTGTLASAVHLTLVRRQVEALKLADSLPAELKPWTTALRLYNTGDWRLLANPKDATLLEQIAYASAVASSVGPTRLGEFLTSVKPAEIPDWSRLALEQDISVDDGHLFATNSIPTEFSALASARKAFSGEEIKEFSDMVKAYNEEPTLAVVKGKAGKAQLEVLSWGNIAAFHQRHLIHAIQRTHYFFEDHWGVPEEAEALRDMVKEKLSDLRMAPLLMAHEVCQAEEMAGFQAGAAAFCQKNPEQVAACIWSDLENPEHQLNNSTRPPPSSRWFSQGLIFGTAHDFCGRDCGLGCTGNLPTDTILAVAAMSPYNHHILRAAARREGKTRAEDLTERYKALLDYHYHAAWEVAQATRGDMKTYVTAMNRVAQLDKDAYITLSDYLAEHGSQEEAAKAFELGFAEAPDRVRVANKSRWIMSYYLRNNREADAVKVAEHAAEVYSFRGLEAAAEVMEKLKRWEKAQEYLEAIAERYGNSGPLMAFYQRNRADQPELGKAYDRIIAKVFPSGMKKVTLADFKDAPSQGTVFTNTNELTQPYGIAVGDVVAALDGYAVDSMSQYDFIRALSPDAPLRLILWNGSGYREVTAHLPERRFQCGMQSYRK